MKSELTKFAQAAGIMLAMALTLSCSSSDDDDDGGGGEGYRFTYSLENVTGSSFTVVREYYECREDGVLEKEYSKGDVNYSINGKTLSFWGLDFSGSSASLAGTWTREPFSASCSENDYYCEDFDGISKAVFTQDFLTLTECIGKAGEVREDEFREGTTRKRKVVDCGKGEDTYTKGNQTVKAVIYYSNKGVYTYNGKTCTWTDIEPSESQHRTACTQAYNKAMAEGNEYGAVRSYYYQILNNEILYKDFYNCLKNNNFPEWFIDD